ncbi:flagellar biosynthetic protein FliO [Rheinheimera sp. WS51]|uniref:flagellar biosynthetic protein FliO n=1 Tax=Rheinheimera sp. WS51 TaxID=3425886 RepID=UPI003D8E2430
MLGFLTKLFCSLLLILAFTSISSFAVAQDRLTDTATEQAKAELEAKQTKATSVVTEQVNTDGINLDATKLDTTNPNTETEKPASGPIKTTAFQRPTTDLTAQDSPRPKSGLSLGKMAISLTIVVLIVLVLGWTFKKLTLRLPGSRHIKIISTTSLGPKEKILVIEMQGKQRVLGVTANSINLLFELENPLPEEKLASDFHMQLQSFLKK